MLFDTFSIISTSVAHFVNETQKTRAAFVTVIAKFSASNPSPYQTWGENRSIMTPNELCRVKHGELIIVGAPHRDVPSGDGSRVFVTPPFQRKQYSRPADHRR